MVLSVLGTRLRHALDSVELVSEPQIQALIKNICAALLESDVNVRLVARLRENIRTKIMTEFESKSISTPKKQKRLQKIIFDELCGLVGSHEKPHRSRKLEQSIKPVGNGGKRTKKSGSDSHIIMLVGLQGSGKTTSCTKLAAYHKKRGSRVGLVCADTFRAGAFDQLKQNAIKSSIPFYGSYLETDPVKVAFEGVKKFREDEFDIIIVDTSGRHKQEQSLFKEMKQISEAVKPTQTIMVMDASIGQAAEGQAQAFKEISDFGSIILTKMDGHAKGGGAISAVAATKTPIVYIGTGEHVGDFEVFKPSEFVSKLLGIGDLQSLVEHVLLLNLQVDEMHQRTMENFKEGKFTLRDFQTQMNNFLKMGPLTNIVSMIPGMSNIINQVGEEETSKKIKNMIFIMDSMTAKELDSDGKLFTNEPDRVVRVAIGSGCPAVEVEMVIHQQRMMALMAGAAKNMSNSGQITRSGGGSTHVLRMTHQAQPGPDFMHQAMSMFGGGGGTEGDMQSSLSNSERIQQAQQMVRQNPNLMQQAQQIMQDPAMVQEIMQKFGGLEGM